MKYFTIIAFVMGMGISFVSKADQTCTEGQKQMFLEDDGSGEHMNPVLYVCHNGVYEKAHNLVAHKKACKCIEGAQEMFLEDDGSGEHMNPVLYTCHNGVFERGN